MIECSRCGNEASYILVNYHHEIVGEAFCGQHAFSEEREKCPCCDDYGIEVYDEEKDRYVEFLPTYPAGTLDNQGCCSEHP